MLILLHGNPPVTLPLMVSTLLLLVLLGASGLRHEAPPDPVHLYTLALEHLLGGPGEHDLVVQATPQDSKSQLRPRRASGEPLRASVETAQRVTRRLTEHGYRIRRGTGASLRLTLGELRYEPPVDPTFARLTIQVSSTAGGGEVLEFLLKREPSGWRVLKSEVEGSIGAIPPMPAGPLAPAASAPVDDARTGLL